MYIKTVAFPSLRFGKRIDAEDWRLLFLPIPSREDNGGASDKADGQPPVDLNLPSRSCQQARDSERAFCCPL